MPKKFTPPAKKSGKNIPASKSTPVRNTPIPRAQSAAPTKKSNAVTAEMIAQRAYFISMSGNGSSQDENWLRAERELRGL